MSEYSVPGVNQVRVNSDTPEILQENGYSGALATAMQQLWVIMAPDVPEEAFDWNRTYKRLKEKDIDSLTPEDLKEFLTAANHFSQHARQVLLKNSKDLNVPEEEQRLFLNHLGFLLSDIVGMMSEEGKVMNVLCQEPATEVRGTTQLYPEEKYCLECKSHHKGTTCQSHYLHGPQLLEHLKTGSIEGSGTLIIYIGTSEIYYLPVSQLGTMTNMSIVDPNLTHYKVSDYDEFAKTTTLQYQLRKRLELVSTGRSALVMVEFCLSPDYRHVPDVAHILGFLKVIKTLQKKFFGTLLVLIPPALLYRTASRTAYQAEVKRQEDFAKLAIEIGKVVGVPVYYLNIQEEKLTINNQVWYVRNKLWHREEALFGNQFAWTREFFYRFNLELNKISAYLTPDAIVNYLLRQ